jgi:NAD(P)-dependent dehydrogenase (short-subunit alcohol dehydrogenase family)
MTTVEAMMSFDGQVALVTGASSGIGRAVARTLAAGGASVVLAARRTERLDELTDELTVAGAQALAVPTDVTDEDEVDRLHDAAIDRFGRVDILVNNVAISDNKHIFDISEEEWDKVLAVTLKSQFLMGKHVAQQMAAQGSGGRIVNIGSTSGFMGRSRAVAYSAAKGGVANLTRAMAAQLAPHNIRVNAIVPNKIGSPVGKDEFDATRPVPNMAKRPGQPAEAAKAVLFLVSEDSSFVYGANLFVAGGVSAMDLS